MMDYQLKKIKTSKLFFKFSNRGGYLLPLVLLILVLSSCGIAVPYYLNPPTSLSYSTLSFYNAYINDPNFARGYDFFYRIYDDNVLDSSKAITDASSFFSESSLLGLLSDNRPLFSNTFYRRVFPVSDDIGTAFSTPASAPIMRVDPIYFDKTDSGKKFEANLNILGSGICQLNTINYSPAGYPTTIDLKRYVTNDGINFYDDYFNNFVKIQDDVPDTISDSLASIAFFVVLYGLTDQFVSVFSDVVYIGSQDNISIN